MIGNLKNRVAKFVNKSSHVGHSPRFQRVFVGGHFTYFVGHTFHLPMTEVVTGTLAVLVIVEFVATFAVGGDHD